MRRRLLAAAAVLVLTACGGGSNAAPQPVGQALDRVEALLEAGRAVEARVALDDLVRRTLALRESGDLDPEQADRIVAAATRLIQILPSPRPAPTPTVARTPTGSGDKGKGEDDKGGGKGDGKGSDEDKDEGDKKED